MTKKTMTQDEFATLIERASDLAFDLSGSEGRWPLSLTDHFDNLEEAAQTVNRLAENAAGLQRLILATIALGASERRIRAELTA